MTRRFQFSLASIFWAIVIVGLFLSNSGSVTMVVGNGLISAYAIQCVMTIYRYHRGAVVQQPPSKVAAAFWVVLAVVTWVAAVLYWRADRITFQDVLGQPISPPL